MKRNEPVSKIMSTHLVTVHHGEPVSKVRQLILEHGVHHVPVVAGQKLVGIVSHADVLRVSFGDAFHTDERTVDATLDHTMTLEELMQKDPVAVRGNAPIREAAQRPIQSGLKCPWPHQKRRPASPSNSTCCSSAANETPTAVLCGRRKRLGFMPSVSRMNDMRA